ncbi:MAG: ABC transporter substrate-binding protein [Chloroflexi bacterium]|nr:ABC transporter substrate-binding protein [Chloroflexota bacterium]
MGRNVCFLVMALIALVTLAATGCGREEGPLRKVVFMAGFKAQANLPFVAAYVAREKGYFADQGLDVDMRHSTGQHLQLLMSGDVDFTTADANSVLKRRAGDPMLPIVAIALFGQRGQQAFIVLKESGIQTPKDWEGKTFGYKTSVPPDYLAILKAAGVDRSRIKEVAVGFDPRILVEKKLDILAVFKSNEPDVLRGLGHEVRVFDPADYGVPTLGLTYITREDLIQKDPDTVRRFIKATMKGLEFAFNNREEALDIVMKYADKEERGHMGFMMQKEMEDAVSPLTEKYGLGWMSEEQWQAFHDSLLEYQALPGSVDVKSAFTDRFLKEIYRGGKLRWP